MGQLTWTRRGFLKFSALLSGAALLTPAAVAEAVAPVPLPAAPLLHCEIHELCVSSGAGLGRFVIGRSPTQILVSVALNPQAMFRWVSAPSCPMVTDPGGLLNLSDGDVTIDGVTFSHAGELYHWSLRGGTVPFYTDSPRRVLPIPIVVPA